MICFYVWLFFLFKQKTAYEVRSSDWSSDVCSSDLRVELVRKVVVVGDVLARPAERVVLAAPCRVDALDEPHQRVRLEMTVVARCELEEVERCAVLDREDAVHIGFRHGQPGIREQGPVERAPVQPYRAARLAAVPDNVRTPSTVDQPQTAVADHVLDRKSTRLTSSN